MGFTTDVTCGCGDDEGDIDDCTNWDIDVDMGSGVDGATDWDDGDIGCDVE